MLKGTNIQSGQLLNSFLTTYNKMKSGTGASLNGMTGTGEGANKSRLETTKPMEGIAEKPDEGESQTNEQQRDSDYSDDEDMDRGNEVIDLDKVSVTSSVIKNHEKAKKAIISQDEAKKLQE
jgi:hypothetical protein